MPTVIVEFVVTELRRQPRERESRPHVAARFQLLISGKLCGESWRWVHWPRGKDKRDEVPTPDAAAHYLAEQFALEMGSLHAAVRRDRDADWRALAPDLVWEAGS